MAIIVETYYVPCRHVWMNRVPGGMVLHNEYLHRDQAVEHGRELAALLGGRHETCSLVPAPRSAPDVESFAQSVAGMISESAAGSAAEPAQPATP